MGLGDPRKITARQLACAMCAAGMSVRSVELQPFALESRRGGFIPGQKRRMGRTYFFSADDLEAERMRDLYQRVVDARQGLFRDSV